MRVSRIIPNLPKAEITRWPGSLDATIPGKRDSLQWESFLAEFLERRDFLGDRHPGWSAAILRGNKRALANVEAVTAAVIEYDEQSQLSLVDIEATWGKCYGLVHTTKSHSETKLSCRVILPLARHISAAEWRLLWPLLNEHSGGVIDPAPKDASRLWYMPGVVDDGPYYAAWLDGDPLNPDEWLAKVQPRKPTPRGKPAAAAEQRAVAYLDKMPPGISGQQGHQATWRAAVALARGFDLSEEDTYRILRDHFNPRCEPPWTERELRHKAQQARDNSTLQSGYLLERDRDRVFHPINDSDIGPPPAAENTTEEWHRSLRYKNDALTKDAGNAALIIANAQEWSGVLAYDSFRDVAFWAKDPPTLPGLSAPRKGESVADHHELYVQHWLAKFRGVSFSKEAVFAAMISAARTTEIHPVREYLDRVRWDGTPRVTTWLSRYLGAPANDYTHSVGAWWLISAVARVMEPGCQADHMLILEGKQGKGKTSAVAALAGEWFLPRLPSLQDKDSMQVLLGHWICEIGELDALRGRVATQVKDYVSSRIDVYRPSFGRATVRRPRQIVFIGTTNEDAYLQDSTGARRFWPVRVGSIDLEALKADRDQLWAEAAHRYHHDEPWHPTVGLNEKITAEQEDRHEGDPWDERIEEWAEGRPPFTAAEVLSGPLNIEPGKQDRGAQTRVGHCLRRLGYMSRKVRKGGLRRVYERAGQPDDGEVGTG